MNPSDVEMCISIREVWIIFEWNFVFPPLASPVFDIEMVSPIMATIRSVIENNNLTGSTIRQLAPP